MGNLAVNQKLADDLVASQRDQVFRRVLATKFLLQMGGVIRAHNEADHVAGVAKNGRAHLFRNLGNVLVG